MAFLEAFPYYPATVIAIRDENALTKTFEIRLDTPWKFKAGGRCVIRLTDENGYKAARDYSLSSAPSSGKIEFTVAHPPYGEVSSWLHERIKPGDTLEISKPLGEFFTWDADHPESIFFIAGGIGVAPFMSILREHRASQATADISLLYSVKSPKAQSFREELTAQRPQEKFHLTYTQTAPLGWFGDTGRVTKRMIEELLTPDQAIYISGPTTFVDSVEHILLSELNVAPDRIRVERFG